MKNEGPFRGDKIFCHPERLHQFLNGGNDDLLIPVTVELDVTNHCNARCPDCAGGRQNLTACWTEDHLALFPQMADAGVKAVTFTGGGEPALHPMLPEFIYAAKQDGLDVALISNGIKMSNAVIEATAACCTWARISIAPTPDLWQMQTGVDKRRFESVIDNIKRLVTAGLNGSLTIGLGCLTDRHVVAKLESASQLSASLGVDYLQLRPKHGNEVIIHPHFISALQKKYPSLRILVSWHKYKNMLSPRSYGICYGHLFTSVIQADSRMSICCHTRGVDELCWGDVIRDGFLDTWKSAEHREKIAAIDLEQCVPVCRCDHFNGTLYKIRHCDQPWHPLDAYDEFYGVPIEEVEHVNFL